MVKTLSLLAILGLLLGISTASLFAQLKLNGAGATFPNVIYSKWFDVYHSKSGVEFNYQSIGSGAGIKQVIEGTVDFGATDGPMNDQQLAEAKTKQGTDVVHIPTVLGAVVLTYNIPSAGAGLKLSGDVVAGIFLGEITNWNDSKIAALNPDRQLPDLAIIVAHRSDGSGTSFIFTDYLSKVSDAWTKKVGKGTSVNWPVGLGGKGNEGVTGVVKQSEGSIGYVELAYAVKNSLPYASVKNSAGNFITPTFESVTAAASGAAKAMPDDFRVSITNAEGKDSYPISSFTWLLVYKSMKDPAKAKALVDFLHWALKDGEGYAKDLYYAPLPKEVIKLCEKKINTIDIHGG
jgi:phosphate transport system substrate-binding protein